MSRNRVTIADVARVAGVSVGTVSNALNSNLGQVSEQTRAKVLAVVDELGYRGSAAAATLRSGRHGAISLHVPQMVRALSFYMDFTLGVEDAAVAADLDLLLVMTDRVDRRRRPRVDGAIVVDWTPELRGPAQLHAAGVPLIAAGGVPNEADPHAFPAAVVRVDYGSYVRRIVAAAARAGAARPGMLAPDSDFESDWSTVIVDAFRGACRTAGLEPALRRISVAASAAEVVDASISLQSTAAADFLLFGPQRFAGIARATLGWGAPTSDVPWLASCAGDPVSEISDPVVTAIDVDARSFGARCGQELVAILSNQPSESPTPFEIEHPATISWAEHWPGPKATAIERDCV